MVKTRQKKVDLIASHIPEQKLDSGPEKGKVLVLGWGSTYGAIKSACRDLQMEGMRCLMRTYVTYVLFQKTLATSLKTLTMF
jgi:2-oxoglutarate ferredoxin oxidoreductase subunit alpha